MSAPVLFRWNGEAMEPASKHWARESDKLFVVGECYRLTEEREQSDKSRGHEFAFLREAWNSFPDSLYDQFPSPEHLRKYGLIRTGFCTMLQFPCGSMSEAERLASALRLEADKYAIVTVERSVVTLRKAESQSRKAMGAKRFQESKQALLQFVGDLIGVDPASLANVREAA